jgi:carboxymethylenebutenolidase
MPDLVPIPSPGVPVYYGDSGSPLVVLLHDWYGRLPGLEPYAQALARVGFRVAVPDLYDGVCTVDAGDAEGLADALDLATSLDLIDDVIRDARAEGSERVGVVGFSMGGNLALLHAQGGGADAVVAYYAGLPESAHGLIPNPVLLHLAEFDAYERDEDLDAFIARLKEHGTPVTDHTYIGTEHSFANATIPAFFDANASALAYARTASFLEKYLVD